MTPAFSVLALLIAIAAVVLAFIFIIPEKKRSGLNKFGKFLHDTLNFKYLIVEKVLQALYIFATAFSIAYGFFMLFYVQKSYFDSTIWYGGYGLLLMILGPVAIRIVYELIMLIILLVKNVISINNKLANQNDDGEKPDLFAIPDLKNIKSADTPAQSEAAPAALICPACGAQNQAGTFCTKCGTKLN